MGRLTVLIAIIEGPIARRCAVLGGVAEVAVLDRRVIRNEIEHDFHPELVRALHQGTKRRPRSPLLSDVEVIGDGVAEIPLRAFEDRAEPEGGYAELGQRREAFSNGFESRLAEEWGHDAVDNRFVHPARWFVLPIDEPKSTLFHHECEAGAISPSVGVSDREPDGVTAVCRRRVQCEHFIAGFGERAPIDREERSRVGRVGAPVDALERRVGATVR